MVPLGEFKRQLLHVVPALLPDTCARAGLSDAGQPAEACFAFFTGAHLMSASHIDASALRSRCSLPAGIFEQVRWG